MLAGGVRAMGVEMGEVVLLWMSMRTQVQELELSHICARRGQNNSLQIGDFAQLHDACLKIIFVHGYD